MPFKINIGTKEGKTWKLETESKSLEGKGLKQLVKGEEIMPELAGYEFEITGASDKSGFTSMEEIEGTGLKKILLTYGKAMKKRPKHEGKHKRSKNRPKGLRLRKTVRGKIISEDIRQINLKLLKTGSKKLEEIFPDQTPKPAEPEQTTENLDKNSANEDVKKEASVEEKTTQETESSEKESDIKETKE